MYYILNWKTRKVVFMTSRVSSLKIFIAKNEDTFQYGDYTIAKELKIKTQDYLRGMK